MENAKEMGLLLLEAQERAKGTSIHFKKWVGEETDIGYSTALLWIDVAKHYESITKQFVNSNGLELTIRKIRDAIRDARQAEGRGKPGSGKKKTQTGKAQQSADTAETTTQQPIETAEGEAVVPATSVWDRTAKKAEDEAARIDGGDKTEQKPANYKLTVMVFTEAVQTVNRNDGHEKSPTNQSHPRCQRRPILLEWNHGRQRPFRRWQRRSISRLSPSPSSMA